VAYALLLEETPGRFGLVLPRMGGEGYGEPEKKWGSGDPDQSHFDKCPSQRPTIIIRAYDAIQPRQLFLTFKSQLPYDPDRCGLARDGAVTIRRPGFS